MTESTRNSGTLISIIQDVTNLDVVLLGKDGQILEELGRHNVPNEFFFTIEEILRLRTQLSYGETIRCANSVTGAGLSYLAFRYLPSSNKEGLLLIGPFLVMPVPSGAVNGAILKYRLPVSDKPSIENLFNSIPHVGKEYASNLGLTLRALLQDSLTPLEMIDFRTESEQETTRASNELSIRDQNRIKDFYVMERILRGAVKAGNSSLFREVSREGNYFNYFKFRVTEDTLRAAKNMNIGYNAMLRFAALDGGANPILVHALTWKYVRIAQAAHGVEELMKTQNAMAEEFIALVRKRNLEEYGSTMREALEYLDMHLNGKVTLKALADFVKMSPSNLAYHFKKELHITFQEYMGRKRVDEACLLLNDAGLSIKEISAMVGFCNVSHFIKVFRAYKGSTPKQYRQSLSLLDK